MFENDTNPYAPPQLTSEIAFPVEAGQDELASQFTRFASALVDGLCAAVILFPLQYFSGYYERLQSQEVGVIEHIVMTIAGMISLLLLHGYLLLRRGQTIGKMLTNLQIVDSETGSLLPFLRVFVYRYLWSVPFLLLVYFIPGTIDNILLNLVIFAGVLMIFRADRRCLHDFLAGSKVVLYREDRPFIPERRNVPGTNGTKKF